VSSPATFGPGQYLPAARTTMISRRLRSAAVSARAVRGMARRRVGRSTAETHTGCRSPNSREAWQLVLKTQTEERTSAFNTSGRGSLWKSLDSRCGMCLSTKTGTVIEYSLGSCRGRRKVAQVPPSRGEHGTKHKHAVPAAKAPDGAVRSTAGKKEGSPPPRHRHVRPLARPARPSTSS
jgi:hypothetical protein